MQSTNVSYVSVQHQCQCVLKKPQIGHLRAQLWGEGLKTKLPVQGIGWLLKSALLYCTCTVLVVSIQSAHASVTIHQRNVSHLGPKTLGCKSSSASTSCLRSLGAMFACNVCLIFILCLFESQVYIFRFLFTMMLVTSSQKVLLAMISLLTHANQATCPLCAI